VSAISSLKLSRSFSIISSGLNEVEVVLVPSGGAFGCGGSGDDGGIIGVSGGDWTRGVGWCMNFWSWWI